MRVFAVSMFKDEEDVAEHVLSHFEAQGVDGIIVADNISTDRTRERLEQTAERLRKKRSIEIHIVEDRELAYYQSKKMTALAAQAGARGATWIVPFDADELWHPADGSTLAAFFRGVHPRHHVVTAQRFTYVASARDDPAEPIFFRRLQWRARELAGLPKVAVRWHRSLVIHQGNHEATFRGVAVRPTAGLIVRHYPYRSVEHFVRKVSNGKAAYKAMSRVPEDQMLEWRHYGRILERGGSDALRAEWDSLRCAEPERDLVHDPYVPSGYP